jgi:hypothetical protein
MRRLLGLVARIVKTGEGRLNTVTSGNLADHLEAS